MEVQNASKELAAWRVVVKTSGSGPKLDTQEKRDALSAYLQSIGFAEQKNN
jgi:hypothetical protein